MIRRVWQLRYVLLLAGLLAAFAACVKEKDPNQYRDELKEKLTELTNVINKKDLASLGQSFDTKADPGKGPNALLSQITLKVDSAFVMHKRKVSIDQTQASIRFTFSDSPDDSVFSYLYLRRDGNWKIVNFEIH